MSLVFYVKVYGVMLAAFLAVDMVWLAVLARRFYQQNLGFLLADRPNWTAAVLFYLLFVAGMLVFVVQPNLQNGAFRKVVLMGAFFGLVTYATYDLTNHATVKGWPWIVTVVDLLWGMFLSGTVCTVGYVAGRWLR